MAAGWQRVSAPPGAAGRRHGHQPSGSQDAHETGRNQYLHAEFRSAVFGFVDDVEFYFSPPGTIQVRSASRTGYCAVGSVFEVTLIGEQFVDLYAYNFTLNFDQTHIHAVSVGEGLLLASAGTTLFIPGVIDNAVGSISFTGNTLLGAILGANGDGSLAIMGFEAISEGTSPLSLSDFLFLDSQLVDLAYSPQESMVTVVADGGSPIPEPATLPLLMGFGTYATLRKRKGSEFRESCGDKKKGPARVDTVLLETGGKLRVQGAK